MPTRESSKAIASRNAATRSLFERDIVLPSLGEDPEGFQRLEAEWLEQHPPHTLLERHSVEKIAAASWRLRRPHRWQSQLFEDDTFTECERLDRLDKVNRHETALHHQIDTAVKMLAKDAPHLYAQRGKVAVLANARIAEREYRDCAEYATNIDLQIPDHRYRIRKATEQAMKDISLAPLDTAPEETAPIADESVPVTIVPQTWGGEAEICENEPVTFYKNPFRLAKYRDPDYHERSHMPAYTARAAKDRRPPPGLIESL